MRPSIRTTIWSGFFLLLVWDLLIVLAPLMMQTEISWLPSVGSAIYFLMDPVCHQLPQRSLFIGSLPMTVCARCFAIYTGGLAMFAVAVSKSDFRPWTFPVYGVLFSVLVVYFIAEKIGLIPDIVEIRMLSGFIGGWLIFRLLLEALAGTASPKEVLKGDSVG